MRRTMQKTDHSMQKFITPLIASLTLGLAPFVPEPHIVGKLQWLLGGGEGMGMMDYFDTLMHGAPWLWLIGTGILHVMGRARATG